MSSALECSRRAVRISDSAVALACCPGARAAAASPFVCDDRVRSGSVRCGAVRCGQGVSSMMDRACAASPGVARSQPVWSIEPRAGVATVGSGRVCRLCLHTLGRPDLSSQVRQLSECHAVFGLRTVRLAGPALSARFTLVSRPHPTSFRNNLEMNQNSSLACALLSILPCNPPQRRCTQSSQSSLIKT